MRGGTQRGCLVLGRAGGCRPTASTTDSRGPAMRGARLPLLLPVRLEQGKGEPPMDRLLATTTVVIGLGFGGAALAATNLPGGLADPVCVRGHSDQCLQRGQNGSVGRQL